MEAHEAGGQHLQTVERRMPCDRHHASLFCQLAFQAATSSRASLNVRIRRGTGMGLIVHGGDLGQIVPEALQEFIGALSGRYYAMDVTQCVQE